MAMAADGAAAVMAAPAAPPRSAAAGVLGLVADHWGLTTTLNVIAALPVIGLLIALTLPRRA